MDRDFELAVVGAGAVGLAVAAEAAQAFGEGRVVLLEQHARVGQETSSRSSDVLHACLYYQPGSLKARLCKEGAERLLALCAQDRIAHDRCGKILVAHDQVEIEALEALQRNALACGIDGLEMLDGQDVHRLEPLVSAEAGLWSPNTAIFDSWDLMQYFKTRFLAAGGHLVLRAEVVGLDPETGRMSVRRPGGRIEEIWVGACVNCGGLRSDELAATAGVDVDSARLRLRYCKGSYFAVSARIARRISHLIYPVPGHLSGGLGVHFTPDLSGAVRLGPDATYVPRHWPPDYEVDESLARLFWQAGKRLIPSLRLDDLRADTSGIRPRLYGPGDKVRDFEILVQEGPESLMVHLVGIESPGLTASPALGAYVVRFLTEKMAM